ncbi:hypothetical protein AC791_14635 [Klebsiella sp. RIT-PI-d]|uniref:EpsG family protein n=1 Tax=Klebsiella sp. RIT-PI-d TaxID=1681196 RepID=UPI0006763111|nr:EpsG family protein [Klebsiella sp. RIT-PI-d]KNC09850.1 hypothetical protein AC791_14635 [Klebsiella sp. RIT-PI-d]
MLIYYIIIFSTVIIGYVYEHSDKNLQKIINFLFIAIFTVVIGLRNEVGVDWFAYIDMYLRLTAEPFVYDTNELLYKFLNVVSYYTGIGFGLVVFMTTFIFILCSIRGPKIINLNPYYFFAVVGSYYFVMAGLNFIRQGVALAIMVVAFSHLINGSKIRFLVTTFLAGMFHTSALLLIVFIIADLNIIFVVASVFFVLGLVIYFPIERYQLYLTSDMENAGLVLRVGYLIVPSIYIIFNFKSWLKKSLLIKRLYIISIFFAPTLATLSLVSSTISDRVAYYFIIFITLLVMKLVAENKNNFNKVTLIVMFVISMIALSVWSYNSKYIEYYRYNSYLIKWLS